MEINNCPCCRHAAHVIITFHQLAWASCKQCGLSIVRKTEAEAIEAWNARIGENPALMDIVAALRNFTEAGRIEVAYYHPEYVEEGLEALKKGGF